MNEAGPGNGQSVASSDGNGDSKLLGRCGIYCGACYILRAGRDGGPLLEEVAAQLNRSKEDIHCDGCSGPDASKWENCRKCNKTACMDGRGYRTCSECPSFREDSCDMLRRLQRGCEERGEDPRAAMRMVAEGKAGKWLEEQRIAWRCHHCQGPTHWGEARCHHCGADLRTE